jgi:Type II secretory pathway, ATPase PulE/Tfp pilus assembly pathway, ATPase PilB
VLAPDAAIREAILKRATAGELRQIAIASGMVTMAEDGFAKAQSGITTIDEVLSTLYE